MRLIPLFLVLCASMPCLAQKDSADRLALNKIYRPSSIGLPEGLTRETSTSIFSRIEVLDERKDTLRLGLARRPSARKQLICPSLSSKIEGWLSKSYTHASGGHQLLVVIRDLWFFDDADTVQEGMAKPETYVDWKNNIAFRWEAWLRSGQDYIPLLRMDTTVSSARHAFSIMAETELPQLAAIFMDKIASIDIEGLAQRKRSIPRNTLDSFNRCCWNYAMDTATFLKKGVYMSVDEFLANSPSATDYEIVRNKKGESELNLRDADGKLYFSRQMWGFCDGNHYYMVVDGTLAPIFASHHAFYVYGSRDRAVKTFSRLRFPTLVTLGSAGFAVFDNRGWFMNNTSKIQNLYRLDTRSGELTP